jgi:hypothetical protein
MKTSGGIAGYFQHIHDTLNLSHMVEIQDVRSEKRTSTEGFVRGDVRFKDGSQLHFRELITTEPSVQRISYTYHYMRADGTMVFRYDDTDHFPNLPTAPHHKHIGEQAVIAADAPDLAVIAADAPDLAVVLAEIETMLRVK